MSKKTLQYLILGLLALVWGSSFILMKQGLIFFSAFELGAWRMFSAFLFFLPMAINYFKRTPKDLWLWLAIAGLSGNAVPAFLFPFAQTKLNSSTVGVLNALVPIFTLIIGAYIVKALPRNKQIIGVIVGFCGAVALVLIKANGQLEQNYTYGLYIVLATFLYGISVNVVKHKLQSLPPLQISAMAIFCIGLPCGIYLFTSTDFVAHIYETKTINNSLHTGWQALGYISLLGLMGTAASLILWNYLVSFTDVIFSSSVTYLIPLVALGWGIVDGEAVGWIHLIGFMTILGGVWLISSKK